MKLDANYIFLVCQACSELRQKLPRASVITPGLANRRYLAWLFYLEQLEQTSHRIRPSMRNNSAQKGIDQRLSGTSTLSFRTHADDAHAFAERKYNKWLRRVNNNNGPAPRAHQRTRGPFIKTCGSMHCMGDRTCRRRSEGGATVYTRAIAHPEGGGGRRGGRVGEINAPRNSPSHAARIRQRGGGGAICSGATSCECHSTLATPASPLEISHISSGNTIE